MVTLPLTQASTETLKRVTQKCVRAPVSIISSSPSFRTGLSNPCSFRKERTNREPVSHMCSACYYLANMHHIFIHKIKNLKHRKRIHIFPYLLSVWPFSLSLPANKYIFKIYLFEGQSLNIQVNRQRDLF